MQSANVQPACKGLSCMQAALAVLAAFSSPALKRQQLTGLSLDVVFSPQVTKWQPGPCIFLYSILFEVDCPFGKV